MKYILLLLWFLFMTYLSHQDGAHTAVFSRRLAEQFGGKADAEKINRINGKLRRFAHVFVFFVLTVLCRVAFDSYISIAAVCLWAWADEATKPWIEGRHFSWYDVGLNLIGVGIGLVVWLLLWAGTKL